MQAAVRSIIDSTYTTQFSGSTDDYLAFQPSIPGAEDQPVMSWREAGDAVSIAAVPATSGVFKPLLPR